MRKITIVLKNFMLLCFLLLLANCGTNEIEDNSTASEVDEVKNWYTGHKGELNSPILEYIDSIKWENALISDGIDGKVIEVPFTLHSQLKSSNEKANLFNDHHRLVFIKGEESFQTYYVQIFTDDASKDDLDKSYSYYGMKNNFNGKVFVQDLRSNKTNVIQFKNGNTTQLSSTSKWREETYDCTFLGYWGEGGSFHPIKLLYCDGGGYDDGEPYPQYGGGGGGAGGGSTAPVKPQITSNLTGKAKCLNDLLNQKGNSFVEKLLNNFAGVSEFNIIISSKDVVYNAKNEERNGLTSYTPGSSNIKIDINTSALDGVGALEAARIILHEYIHADMFRKLNTQNKADVDASNFREVFTKYKEQHNAMANEYISSMKEALKDFHKNVLTEDFAKYKNYYEEEPDDAFYEAMCWGGLKDEGIQAWKELPEEKKASIDEIFANKIRKLSKDSPCK